MIYFKKCFLFPLLTIFFFSSCSRFVHKETIKIACTPLLNFEILEIAKGQLIRHGIDLTIIEVDDYNIPNKLLEEGQIDANFFQHIAFLNEYMVQNNADFSVLLPVLIAPVGIYSNKIRDSEEIKNFSKESLVIAIPNDRSNEPRALNLLIESGIISLKDPSQSYKDNLSITAINVEGYSRKVKILETDAVILPRCLPDVDLAVIPTGVALVAGLHPERDAIIIEKTQESQYVNVIAVRTEDINKPSLVKFKEIMSSPEMKKLLKEKFRNYGLLFL